MFIQNSGTWPELQKNVDAHKTVLLKVGTTGNMVSEIQRTLESRLQKKYSNIKDMLKVQRSPENDDFQYGEKRCAYLITLGDFSSNVKAKMLLEREF
jgi:hypothetical protein